jgi:hypothetical protein
MREDVIEKLFSLFTSPDRAEGISGDLIEEREQRGWLWYWLQAVGTTLALWRGAAADGPLRVLGLTLIGCALLAVPAFGGAAAVLLFPRVTGSPASWIALTCFWWGGALWTGASLVSVAPRSGMAACATLAVAGEALLIVLAVMALRADVWSSASLLFYAAGLAAMLLLVGAALARRRLILASTPPVQGHQ